MKIDVKRIPQDGLILSEELNARAFDLETDVVRVSDPIAIRARVSRITNVVSVHITVHTIVRTVCSRCLKDMVIPVDKAFSLNYPVDKTITVIDLDPDIREELIVDLPVKPMCVDACKGLCPLCGKNLNEGGCSCGST